MLFASLLLLILNGSKVSRANEIFKHSSIKESKILLQRRIQC